MPDDVAGLRTEASDPSDLAQRQRDLMENSNRGEELCHHADIEDAALSLYADVERGFSDQWDRANDAMDYWDIYNCVLGPKQFYSGNSKVYVPIVSDAIDARKTRFTNQIFPQSGKNVEVVTSEHRPQNLLSLLEFYIRKCRLRTDVIPALMINGDIEGQYNIYMHWIRNERHVVWKVKRDTAVTPDPDMGFEAEEPTEDYYDIVEDEIVHQYPGVEILADADVCVMPTSAGNVEEAIARGGFAAIIRRWSKSKVKQLIEDDEIDKEKGEELLGMFDAKSSGETPDKQKKVTDAAGIRYEGGKKVAYVYEVWSTLALEEGDSVKRRMCRMYFGGEQLVLSVRRNPYWCDLCPLLSAPNKRIQGVFKGVSRVKKVETMQYAANDAINEAADSAHYSLLPIVMTDPLKNPRTTTMILNMSAIWETSPQDTQIVKFPELWKDGFEIVKQWAALIFQNLSVNPSMIPQMPQGRGGKTNQAQVAQEQQVDLLTTADVVTEIEGSILTPVLRWFVYLDHQFRDEKLMVRQFGLEGKRMTLDNIQPVQMDRRFEVRWFGVEAARSAQQMQLQMAGINMVRAIPPEMYEGFKLNLTPVIQQFLENLFGPRVTEQIFEDVRARLTLDAEFENELLKAGFEVPVQALDDDAMHMQVHAKIIQEEGDPAGVVREHMMYHQMSMQKKQQAQQMQQIAALQAKLQPPGGGQQRQPRAGAKAGNSRGIQQPVGAIPNDQMRGTQMPRPRGI